MGSIGVGTAVTAVGGDGDTAGTSVSEEVTCLGVGVAAAAGNIVGAATALATEDDNSTDAVETLGEIAVGELDLTSTEIFLETLDPGGAGNGHDPRFSGEQPGQCHLSRRRALTLCDRLEKSH